MDNNNDVLFKLDKGKAYFQDGRGYGAEECVVILNALVGLLNNNQLVSTKSENKFPDNVINYEDILDKRVVSGDTGKLTQKLKQWLDNDPEVQAEDKEEDLKN